MSVEDRMIAQLTLHRDLKEQLMAELQKLGIQCQETPFTDPNGDILLLDPKDIPRAQRLIQHLQQLEKFLNQPKSSWMRRVLHELKKFPDKIWTSWQQQWEKHHAIYQFLQCSGNLCPPH